MGTVYRGKEYHSTYPLPFSTGAAATTTGAASTVAAATDCCTVLGTAGVGVGAFLGAAEKPARALLIKFAAVGLATAGTAAGVAATVATCCPAIATESLLPVLSGIGMVTWICIADAHGWVVS